MRDLSGTTAATERRNTAVRIVWLVEIDADVPGGGSETLRYASRAYTLDGNAYADDLLADGIRLGWARLRDRGGLASVSGFSLEFSNAEQLADVLDAYVLDNDAVRVYAVFCTGAEDADDRIQLAAGVIEDTTFDRLRLTMRCVDSSDQDFREVPTQKVNLAQHPYAPLSEFGKVVPWSFGTFMGKPLGVQPHIMAARCLDRFVRVYTTGYFNERLSYAQRHLYEWLADAQTVTEATVELVGQDYATTGDASKGIGLRVLPESRWIVWHMPTVATGDNTVSDYRNVSDYVPGETDTTYATIRSGERLSLSFAGIPAQGVVDSGAFTCWIRTGQADVVLSYDGAVVYSQSDVTGSLTYSGLTGVLTANWDLQLLKLDVTCHAGESDVTVWSAWLYLQYWAYSRDEKTAPVRMFQRGYGYKTSATRQNHVISGTVDTVAESPVEILAAALTAHGLYDLPEIAINTASMASAHAARDGAYTFSFQLMETVTWEFWNRFCFESALHVYKDQAGQWKVVARDADAAAQHFFHPGRMALKQPRNPRSEPDVSLERTPTRDVVNEIVLRYLYDPATDSYLKMMVRSPQARYTGTCTVDAAAGTLTDAAAHFASGDFPAFVGDRIYVETVGTLEVTAVNSDTEVAVEAWDQDDSVLVDVTSAANYYGGASISGRMVRSWLRYKTINPLGGEFDPIKRDGGWASDFIADDTTAATFLNYVEQWFSERRIVVELATGMEAIDVELGDVCYLRCPILPRHRDAIPLGALNGALSDSATTLTCSTSGYLGSGAFRDGDYLAIGGEVVQVDGEPDAADEDLTIVRAQCNTAAAAHASGDVIHLLQDKWEVTGVKYDIAKAQIRLQLTEMPRAAYRVGAAMASDDDYDTAPWVDRVAGSWAHPDSGLIAETDTHSDYSYARA